MAPKSRNAPDGDSKPDTTTTKEKNSHSNHHTSGKMRRVASSNAHSQSHPRDTSATTTSSNPLSSAATNPIPQETAITGVQWNTFDRDVLHAYRREYRLKTSPSFTTSYNQMVFSQPGGIGLYSPTMARRREKRRQSKEQLATAIRKHFNDLGVQENEVIVDFIHAVRHPGSRVRLTKEQEVAIADMDR